MEGATSVTVTLQNGKTYPAKSVRTDPIDDLAVIDIETGNLQALTMGDSSALMVGDVVIAMGNSLGKNIEATQGIISGTDLTFTAGSSETLYNTIGTTVQTTDGFSGGPLVNMDRQIIGISTGATLTPTGQEVTSYAISINTAKPVIEELIQQGYVTRAWLGTTVCNANNFQAMGCGPSVDTGAFVIQIAADSPAHKAGLQAGDIITSFNSKVINTTDNLMQAVCSSNIGQQVAITFWRNGTRSTSDVTLIQNPEP